MPNIRILRVLEYSGDAELIYNTLRKGGVPYNGEYSVMGMTIKSSIVGLPDLIPVKIQPSEETPT
jgi:hypothetical protein